MSNKIDGWKAVWCYGEVMWEFWDEGLFILRCSRGGRDEIIKEASLPLKLVSEDIEGLLTTI